jgi:hypothetical protein
MRNLFKGLSKDATYQVLIHLAKRFRGDDFLEINQSEIRFACGGHVCLRIGTKWAILIKGHPRMLPTKFRSIWPSGFRRDDLLEIDQSETRIACGGHVY